MPRYRTAQGKLSGNQEIPPLKAPDRRGQAAPASCCMTRSSRSSSRRATRRPRSRTSLIGPTFGRSTFYVHYRGQGSTADGRTSNAMARAARARTRPDCGPRGPVDVALPACNCYSEHAYRNQRMYRGDCVGGRVGRWVQRHHLRRFDRRCAAQAFCGPQLEQVGAEVPADVAAEFYTSARAGPAWCGGSTRDFLR